MQKKKFEKQFFFAINFVFPNVFLILKDDFEKCIEEDIHGHTCLCTVYIE